MSIEMSNVGKITQIIGAVLDIKFTGGSLPEINEAIKIATKDGGELIVEVSQTWVMIRYGVSPWALLTAL